MFSSLCTCMFLADPLQNFYSSHTTGTTYLYLFMIDLCPQVTIKALATSRDGFKQSSVVTKTFTVQEAMETSDTSMEGVESVSQLPP